MRNRPVLAVVALALLVLPAVPAAAAEPSPPFRDPHLALDARVADLVGRLTLDEKISFLHQYQPAVPRLGLKLFKAGTEALHGMAWSNDINAGGAQVLAEGTAFPQAVGLASTWDPALVRRVGAAVGDEARGFHARDPEVFGLNLWAPVVNPLRDPRWGRNEEGYSEDPLLTGATATAYGHGLQGDDPDHLRTAPTLKHYAAYNNEAGRDVTSSNVPQRVLNEYERPVYRIPLQAGAATGVMASYNLINGRPATVDPDLGTLVRGWSERPLFNVSDAGAPYNLVRSQQYFATQPEAHAAVLKAGLDSFTIDDGNGAPTVAAVKEALAQGLLTESDVDTSVGHALSIRFRLGEFDPDGGPYASIGEDVINSPAHRALAREAAGKAAVLLKNTRGALPLKPGGKVAVVGPLADTLYTDWYGGKLPYEVTTVDGIRERAASVTTTAGADRIALKDVSTGRYVTATDDAVVATGTTAGPAAQFDLVDWGEGVHTMRSVANGKLVGYNWGPFVTRDEQPGGWFVQQQFRPLRQADGSYVLHYAGYETRESWFGPNTYVTVGADGRLTLGSATAEGAAHFTREVISSGVEQAVAAAKGADAAVVVVGSNPFINGREIKDRSSTALGAGQHALVEAVLKANPRTTVVLQTSYPDSITWEQQHVPAILWTTHAGAETGHAVADVLFGAVNPAGRVTQTWPRSDGQLPPDLLDYDIISSEQTYLYNRQKPLYAFGHGLSYTTFRYSPLRIRKAGETVSVSLDVTNTGTRAGDEVVQLYSHQRTSRVKQPVKQLRAFQRVSLAAGATKTVTLRFALADLAHWDVTRGRFVQETSVHDLLAGPSSAEPRQRGSLRVRGETIPARDLTRTTRAESFDAYRGALLVDESKARGTAVSGGWIAFHDARLGSEFTARVAGSGTVQVRLGSPTGRLLGTAEVADTGDKYTYATVRARLAPVRGRHDIHLVLTDGVRLATFRAG
jgi:beta-glucosidase